AGSVRGWQTAYGHAFSDVAIESYSARKAFDGIIRKAVSQDFWISDTGEELKVKFYAGALSSFPDRYAWFYSAGKELNLKYGSLDALGEETELSTVTVCSSVDSCVFKKDGRSIQMIIKLNNGTQSATIVTSAVMHNP
ncbi:MAG: hypothetical protein MUO27_11070, partial [Sedimentisphaerales bacterium]|nr:hypothetical protein [Sedimentisphaerales bacterium]